MKRVFILLCIGTLYLTSCGSDNDADAFIGEWAGTETCDQPPGVNTTAIITQGSEDNLVQIEISGLVFTASVSGPNLVFDSLSASGLMVTGTGTVSENDITLAYGTTDGQGEVTSCIFSATK